MARRNGGSGGGGGGGGGGGVCGAFIVALMAMTTVVGGETTFEKEIDNDFKKNPGSDVNSADGTFFGIDTDLQWGKKSMPDMTYGGATGGGLDGRQAISIGAEATTNRSAAHTKKSATSSASDAVSSEAKTDAVAKGINADDKAKTEAIDNAADFLAHIGIGRRRRATLDIAALKWRRLRARRWDDFARGKTGDKVLDASDFGDALEAQIDVQGQNMEKEIGTEHDEYESIKGSEKASVLKKAKKGNLDEISDAPVHKKYVHEEHWYKPGSNESKETN